MARRFQEITEVYRQELAALARGDKWTAFLRSACRNYKLHFEELVLVHAQRMPRPFWKWRTGTADSTAGSIRVPQASPCLTGIPPAGHG